MKILKRAKTTKCFFEKCWCYSCGSKLLVEFNDVYLHHKSEYGFSDKYAFNCPVCNKVNILGTIATINYESVKENTKRNEGN